MQRDVPASFEREMGCTAAELRGWLPGACAPHPVRECEGGADIAIGSGKLRLRWQPLPPRRIALLSVPRLQVRFDFDALDAAARAAFMQRFDLYTRRGGG